MYTSRGTVKLNLQMNNISFSHKLGMLTDCANLELTSFYFSRLIDTLDEKDTILDSIASFFLIYKTTGRYPLISFKTFKRFLNSLVELSQSQVFLQYIERLTSFESRPKLNSYSFLLFFPTVLEILRRDDIDAL